MPYDCKEKQNVVAWKRLPPSMQHFIRTIQARIQEEVETKNPGMFRATSGFRSESVNRKYGGVVESLHRLGMARDFVNVDRLSDVAPVVDTSRFRVIRSTNCWHIEILI